MSHIYAPDIAASKLIYLGYSDDYYQPQQSIRTFFNRSNPNKYYIKTALSVLNMGFMRGLSAYYMGTTPAINDWLYTLVEDDEYLQSKKFHILREIAATGYHNKYYENDQIKDNPYKKMLAALWRESPTHLVSSNQRLMTMASLLHIDPDNNSFLQTLIKASGLTIRSWLEKYLDVYLSPLLHCYYKHSLVFMPHGENLILAFENHIPVKAIIKDIGEEIYLLNSDIDLSEKVKRISIKVPAEEEILSFYTDVFDCFFRHMTAILVEYCDFSEESFWSLVADCIYRYQQENLHLQDKFNKHDLFLPDFAHSCLNRLQLANNQQMLDLVDPSASLQFAGKLTNPIAKFMRKDKSKYN